MSSAKLCLAGLLVAGGLVLGAFTLHGYFDPQWAQKQAQAATLRSAPAPTKAINAFQHRRSRFVASRAEQRNPVAKRQAATANAAPVVKAGVKAADAREPARKRPARRKVAEKPKPQPQPQPQQAAFQWPLWDLFKN